jgi:predicted Zn-dependent protease
MNAPVLRIPARRTSALAIFAGFLLLINGCSTLTDAVAAVGLVTGVVDEDQAAALSGAGQALEGAVADITPEQEYYIGRSVTALILDSYDLYEDPEATRYLNLLGQSLAAVSSRPILFNGYRFAILDTDEINAFATPGGHILVSRGMLRLAKDEHMLAAVLAHEISHIVLQHGLKAIKTSRWSGAGKSLGVLALEMAADDSSAGELTQMFGESLLDITDTLLEKGYSRNQEKAADAEAVAILRVLGYDPNALVDILVALEENTENGGPGFGKTHPDPEARIESAVAAMGEGNFTRQSTDAQVRRFRVLSGI